MEVGQPAAGAPTTAIAAARAALGDGPLGYTQALGIPSLRQRIARLCRMARLDIDPERIVVTTGSSAAFILAFLAAFEAGDRVAVGCGLSAVPPYPDRARLRAGLIETTAQTRWSITSARSCTAPRAALKGVIVGSPSNPTAR